MTEIKRQSPQTPATALNNFVQERYYDTHSLQSCKAENDNKATLAEQKRRDIAHSESFIKEELVLIEKHFGDGARAQFVTDTATQIKGIDYIVRYKMPYADKELTANIDVKRRQFGSRKYWKNPNVPELCFEVLNNGGRAVACLTDNKEETDYFLFIFEDTGDAFFIPYEQARLVLTRRRPHLPAVINSNGAGTKCVYMPVDEFFTEALKLTAPCPSWLLRGIAERLNEAAAVAAIRERQTNDNRQAVANGGGWYDLA